MSTIRFFGIMCFSASLYAQLSATHATIARSAPLLTASGETSLVDYVPEASADKPISGVISLRELEHPVPKKAIREAYRAQQFARANDVPKAIAKLENAIRIDPQ